MLTFFLARRFYKSAAGDRKRRASKLAIRIATAGVALGLAVMIISISVVKGFQQEISNKLTGFSSHLMVLNDSSFASPQSYPIVTDEQLLQQIEQTPGVKHVQRVSQKMGILKTDSAYQTISLKGVGPEYDLRFMRQQMVEGRIPQWKGDKISNQIVISQMQAQNLGLKVGQKVYAYFFEQTIKMRRLEVVGIYNTNMPHFDRHFVLTDIATLRQLNNWAQDQSSMLEIYVNDFSNLDHVQTLIGKQINGQTDRNGSVYSTLSVKEHPYTASAFSWLEVLNLNVWVILVLMMGVAGFTMISGLLILILERTRTIGVLKAMGATGSRIRHTFIIYAALIVVKGLAWGNLIGLGIILSQQWWGWVQLDPENYYVSAAPVLINGWWILGLNVATLIVTVLSLIVPSFVIAHIQPAKAIQYE